MSTERKPRGRRRAQRAGGQRSPAVSSLREKVGTELASARQVVAALNRDIERYRRENRSLAEDRERLREELAQMDVVRLEKADTESLWRAALRERQRVEDRVAALEAENRTLSRRCVELQRQLDCRGETDQVVSAEVACLEAQIAELQAIIAILSGAEDEVGAA